MFTHHTNNLRTLLITTLLASAAYLFVPLTTAEAAVNTVVNGGSGTNAQRQVVTINNGIRGLLQELRDKELERDPAAERAANEAIRQHVAGIEQALQNGYRGSPIFIENLEIHLTQIESSVFSNVMKEVGESEMCGAFKSEVLEQVNNRFIEANAKTVADKNACAIDAAGEVDSEAFFSGSFDMAKFLVVASDPSQSPFGATIQLEEDAREQIEESRENELRRYNINRGTKDLYAGQNDVIACTEGEENGIRDNCRIAKPGSIWFEQLVKSLNLPVDRIAKADEIGDDQTAGLFRSIVESTLLPTNIRPGSGDNTGGGNTGGGNTGGGNVGGGSSSDPTSPNYTTPSGTRVGDVTGNPDDQVTQGFLAEVATGINATEASSTNPIRPVLIRTLTALQYQLETVSLIDRTENKNIEAKENPEYQEIGCYTLNFTQTLRNERTLTLTEIPFTIDAIKELYPLFVAYEQAVRSNESTSDIISAFQTTLNTNFAIPTEVDLAGIADKFNTTTGERIANFNRSHRQQVDECELILNPPEDDGNPFNNFLNL